MRAYAFPMIALHINITPHLSALRKSSYFTKYANRVLQLPDDDLKQGAANFLEVPATSAFGYEAKAFIEYINPEGRVLSSIAELNLLITKIKATWNCPIYSRKAHIEKQIERLNSLFGQSEIEHEIELKHDIDSPVIQKTTDRKYLISEVINTVAMLPMHERADVLKKCYDLLDHASDNDFPKLFMSTLTLRGRRLTDISPEHKMALNDVGMRHLHRFFKITEDPEIISKGSYNFLSLVCATPAEDVFPIVQETLEQTEAIDDHQRLCHALGEGSYALDKIENPDQRIAAIFDCFSRLEKRAIPNDYNVRYVLVDCIFSLPRDSDEDLKRCTDAEWRASKLLPEMAPGGRSTTNFTVYDHCSGLSAQKMHDVLHRTVGLWLGNQPRLEDGRPTFFPT